MLIVRTPVRISFAGGGTDLPAFFEKHGGAVVSAAINKYFYTVLQRRNDGRIQVISSDLRACETWQNISRTTLEGTELEIPLAVIKELGADISVDLFLASEIPPGTGLGSSASVCVNVLKTVSTYLHRALSPKEIAEEAYRIAREVLKRPVGKQDEFASAFGGVNKFVFNRDGSVDVEPLPIDPAALVTLQKHLMLFFTGTAHNSWKILQGQERSSRADTGPASVSLRRIRDLADEMRDVLVTGDLDAFASILDEGWQYKRKMSDGITNSRIDQLYQLAKANGALGGKITGAGGGGFLLLYCKTENQPRVRQAFQSVGLREMAFEFDFHGSNVIANDPSVGTDDDCERTWSFLPHVRNGVTARQF